MNTDKSMQIRTAEKQKLVIEQLSKTPIIEVVCQKVGIGRNSYYRWRKLSKKFAIACDKALEEGCQFINEMAESTIISAMKDKNLTACMYWLNHRSQAYSNKVEIGGKVEINKDKLTKDQEENIVRALKLASLITNNKGDNHEQSKLQSDRSQKDHPKTSNKS